MKTIRHEAPPKPHCIVSLCTEPVYELEPGLPTMFCAKHRALAVAESNRMRKGSVYEGKK